MRLPRAVVPRTSEPAGSSMLTTMEPGLPNRDRFFGVLTVRRPPEQETSVCCTARTSSLSAPLVKQHLHDRVEALA